MRQTLAATHGGASAEIGEIGEIGEFEHSTVNSNDSALFSRGPATDGNSGDKLGQTDNHTLLGPAHGLHAHVLRRAAAS